MILLSLAVASFKDQFLAFQRRLRIQKFASTEQLLTTGRRLPDARIKMPIFALQNNQFDHSI